MRSSVVRIGSYGGGYDAPGTTLWGSGFFIAPGWVLTSAHVVGHGRGAVWRGERVIRVTTRSGGQYAAELAAGLPRPPDPDRPPRAWPLPDLALLRVPEAVDVDCLWLSDRSSTGGVDVGIYGYVPEQDGTHEWVDLPGRSGGGGDRTLTLDCAGVPRGCSGGPVVDQGRGSVIGVVKARNPDEHRRLRATFVTELRGFWTAGQAARRAWHEALSAHDRHHLDRYRGVDHSWVREQDTLRPQDGVSFGAGQRAELYGAFAALPPPPSSGEVMRLVNGTLQNLMRNPYRIDLHTPRSWRDGVGLLYAPHDIRPDATATPWELQQEAVVLFAARVYASLRGHGPPAVPAPRPGPGDAPEHQPPAPEALHRLHEWVRRYRDPLRSGPARALIDDALAGPEQVAGTPADAKEAPAPSAYADVVVEIEQDWFGSHPWSIKLVHADGQVTPVHNNETGVPRPELEADIRAALAVAFDRGDSGGTLAAVDFVLPLTLFDEPVDTWRVSLPGPGETISAHSLPIGLRRLVALRDRQRALSPPAFEWRKRWNDIADGRPLHAAPLLRDVPGQGHDAAEQEHTGEVFVRFNIAEAGTVPVHCARVGSGRSADALAYVLAAGHPVALWRRCSERHDDCAEFHDRVAELLRTAGGGEGLREQVRELRGRNIGHHATGVGSSWSRELVLLYDPAPDEDHFAEVLREPLLSP